MFDFNTAVQTALSPVVTTPVIAVLAITIVAQTRLMKNRLRKQAQRLGKMTAMLLSIAESVHKRDMERQVGETIQTTYDIMKDIGFDKLARGDVTFEGVMFGDKDEPLRRRQRRDHDPFSPFDTLAPFSMDDLKEALRPKADSFKAGNHSDAHFEEPVKNTDDEGAGLGGKGSRPYHAATADFAPRDPRAPRAG